MIRGKMDDTKILAFLTVVQAMHCATAMFFHEPSNLILQGLGAGNKSDFGFAMAYRYDLKTLVVGAPKGDQIGKVFNCEIYDTHKISCGEQYIDYDEFDYNTEKFPEQRFHLGASIVAASNYVFTCAPLWTTKVNATNKNRKKVVVSDTFGTCFKIDADTTRYQGLLEYFIKTEAKKKGFKHIRTPLTVERFAGGTGWSTLLDEKNDLLLIAKSSFNGDFSYVPASNAILDVKSFVDKYARYLESYWNIGYGLAAGKFFSNYNQTVYAFSMLQKNMEGIISFFTYKPKGFRLSMLIASKAFVELTNRAVGAMFGNTMSSADLNFDGLDELLVGAPAQTEDECYECGALHIYTGGDMKTINEPKRLRSIFGTSNFGRFGSAIVAKDIDGDGKPELIVSAPYENHGSGVIYILSGYEVYHTLMKTQEFKSIQLSDLKLTQKLQKESYKVLGFSLQFVEDVDGNGCDELAAGSPGASKVLIFKCVRKINVTLSTELIGEQLVREQDMSFTVKVCARVEFPSVPDEIVGNVTIENSIIGEAAVILNPVVVIDISCDSCFTTSYRDFCENVTVALSDKEPGDYTFKSKAELQNSYLSDRNMKEFNKTWVEASPYSKLDTSLEVSRHCKGDDCIPRLTSKLDWSGSKPYVLGSSANETVKITVKNEGNASYAACIWLKVFGAPLGLVGCENYNEGYRCYLPTPLKRDANTSIDLKLTMTEPTNIEKSLRVVVHLYENCNKESVYSTNTLEIDYVLTPDGVSNDGDNHRLNITDKQIVENATVYDHHEFPIRNNGSTKWYQVKFSVKMEKKPYINSFNISAASCKTGDEDSNAIIHHCTLVLLPNTTNTIIGTTEILAGRLNRYPNGAKIEMNVSSILYLSDTVPSLSALSVTTITIQKEITLASRKWLIAVIAGIVALIILTILTFILCKVGFFRRKQKQKLIVMQESVRRKSVRRNTHVSAIDGPMEGLQIDVVDDCPFEEARTVTTKDNVGLVEHNKI